MNNYMRFIDTGEVRPVVAHDPTFEGDGNAYCIQHTKTDQDQHGLQPHEWYNARMLAPASRAEYLVDRLHERLGELQDKYADLPAAARAGVESSPERAQLEAKYNKIIERFRYARYLAEQERKPRLKYAGLEVFHVPTDYLDDYDHERIEIIFSILQDGTLCLPPTLTREQYKALRAYLLRTVPDSLGKHGNSLSMLPPEVEPFFHAVIDSLKRPPQKLYERIRDFVLDAHVCTREGYRAYLSFYEEADIEDFSDVYDIALYSAVYHVRIKEATVYEGGNWRVPGIYSHYWIGQPTSEPDQLVILESQCNLVENTRLSELDDED